MGTGSALPGRVPGHDGLHSVEFRRVLKLAHARRHNLATCRPRFYSRHAVRHTGRSAEFESTMSNERR
jgi:hypothetical protein